ncbi:unnamed protein product [Phytomonas sp. Hart1]|nr:unnamed protein product [Phytomonas sp. Hart1]|eukprot:CCW66709.1 unnamed protein product [Phytomonas sp. isolate Hart1]
MSSKGGQNRVKLEVSFATFCNDDLFISNILEPKNATPSFVLTTGCFPHEIIFDTCASRADISSVRFILQDAKDIILESSTQNHGSFTPLLERTLERGTLIECKHKRPTDEPQDLSSSLSSRKLPFNGETAETAIVYGIQTEVVDLDPQTNGKGIQALRLRILSGYSDFVGIFQFQVLGEESEQRIAVVESKPEFTL